MCMIVMGIVAMVMMLVMFHTAFAWPFFQEKEYVDELEDAERIKDEKGDEPPYLAELCRIPESISFDDDGKEKPNCYDKEK